MPTPHAQWEWRTFGTIFGGVDKALCQLTSATRHLRDMCIVSDASDALVRIRRNVIDVKQVIKRDESGAELWAPVLQGTFPLNRRAVAQIFTAWDRPIPTLERDAYGVQAFLYELVMADVALTPVAMLEERHTVYIDGCKVSVSDLWVDGYPLRTVGLVTDQLPLLLRVVRGLQLSTYPAGSYLTALRNHIRVRGCHLRRLDFPTTPNAA